MDAAPHAAMFDGSSGLSSPLSARESSFGVVAVAIVASSLRRRRLRRGLRRRLRLSDVRRRRLKAKGEKAIPRDADNNVVKNVPANDLIEKLEFAGPGFVNIYLNKSFIESSLPTML